MTTVNRPLDRWVHLLMYVNLLALMLPQFDSEWDHAMLMLPLALGLASAELRTHAWRLMQEHRWLTGASVALSVLMAISCQAHQCQLAQFDVVWLPLIWLPVAALTQVDGKHRHLTIFGLALVAIVMMTNKLSEQFFGFDDPRPRGYSFNVLTGPILLALVCAMGAIQSTTRNLRSRGLRWLVTMAVVLALSGAMLTQSRTALTAYVAGSVMLIACNRHKRVPILLLSTLIAAGWFFGLTGRYQEAQNDMARMHQGEYLSSSVGERTDCYKWAAQHLFDAPLLGKGAQTIQNEFAMRSFEWHRPHPRRNVILHLHNDYFQMAIERGLPALALFVGMWGMFIRQALSAGPAAHRSANPWLMAMAAVFMTAFLTDSFTYWVFMWAPVAACFGMGIGLMGRAVHGEDSPP